VIFDPFMGTGNYLAALLKLGRRIIDIDYNEEKYNITKETYFRKWNSISSSNTSTPTEK
jgi:DNA modification methylase